MRNKRSHSNIWNNAFNSRMKGRNCHDEDDDMDLPGPLEDLLSGAMNTWAISNQEYRETRYLILTGPVTTQMFNEFRLAISEMNEDSSTDPIYVEVDTPGGDTFAMIGIMNTMLSSKAPVDTFCQSKAHSAGAWIYLAGRNRYAPPTGLASFLFHPARWSMSGVHGEYTSMVTAMDAMVELLATHYASKTKLTSDQIDKFSSMHECYYIGKELFDLGICTDALSVNDLAGRYSAAKEKAQADHAAMSSPDNFPELSATKTKSKRGRKPTVLTETAE